MAVRGKSGQVSDNALWRLAPRFGFAYDVFGDGTTAIHGGWGLFNNKIGDLSYADGIRTNPPQFADPSISIFNAGTTPANFSYGNSTERVPRALRRRRGSSIKLILTAVSSGPASA